MRVLVTGASGFAGGWLVRELEDAGHVVIAAPGEDSLDLAGSPDFRPVIEAAAPVAIVHLAAISFAPDAARDPDAAWRVNVGGTEALLAGLDAAGSDAAVLVTSSSEVYGRFSPADLPLRESLPPRASGAYGDSKVGQEAVTLAAAARGRPVVIVRPFNHTGPGQRPVFVAPALARRVLDVRAGRAAAIRVGNQDVRRDLSDVRDVVVAYRLLLEALVDGRVPQERPIYNVASGRAVPIRHLVEVLCAHAGVPVRTVVDPALTRSDDIPEIRGDASAVTALTGWRPSIPLEQTLADLLASLESAG